MKVLGLVLDCDAEVLVILLIDEMCDCRTVPMALI